MANETNARLTFCCVLAASCASAGMPAQLTLRHLYNGGNCETIREVDARGRITGSSGCESGAKDDGVWLMSGPQLDRFIAAVDRLRARRDDLATKGERGCPSPSSLSLLLVESSGRRRRWDYCAPGLAPSFPSFARRLMQLLSPPR